MSTRITDIHDMNGSLEAIREYVKDLEGTIKLLELMNEQLRDKLKSNMFDIRAYNKLHNRIHSLPFGEQIYNYLTK